MSVAIERLRARCIDKLDEGWRVIVSLRRTNAVKGARPLYGVLLIGEKTQGRQIILGASPRPTPSNEIALGWLAAIAAADDRIEIERNVPSRGGAQ